MGSMSQQRQLGVGCVVFVLLAALAVGGLKLASVLAERPPLPLEAAEAPAAEPE